MCPRRVFLRCVSEPRRNANMTDPNMSSWFLDFAEAYDDLNISFSNDTDFIPDPATRPCSLLSIPAAASLAVAVFYSVIFALAIPGNLVVVLVIGLCKQALPPSDLYLLHLALADLLLAITLPFWSTSLTRGWVFGDAMCKLVAVLQELSFYSSILFLACISVDRYLVIVRATEARWLDRRLLSWGICAGVWVAGGLLSLPGLLNSTFNSQNSGQLTCAEDYDLGSAEEWRLVTRVLRHTLGFFVPLAVMLPCYGITVRRLLRVRGGFLRQRAMRVIVSVVVAFLFCWTPYHLAVMADTFLRAKIVPFHCPARTAVDRAMFVTQSLGMLHSCVNPVLYAFVGEKFRRRLGKIMRKMGVMERTSGSRSSRSSLSSDAVSSFM